jgi:hypothetical protein
MTSSEVIKLSANSFAILVIVLLGLVLIPVPEDLPTKIVAAVLLALGLALNVSIRRRPRYDKGQAAAACSARFFQCQGSS